MGLRKPRRIIKIERPETGEHFRKPQVEIIEGILEQALKQKLFGKEHRTYIRRSLGLLAKTDLNPNQRELLKQMIALTRKKDFGELDLVEMLNKACYFKFQ